MVDLLSSEDAVIDKAKRLLEQDKANPLELKSHFEDLLKAYIKLNKGQNRLIRLSDKSQNKLNIANAKLEEVSQSLMELAIHNNIIVFAVSEITKSAYAEGMNIASAKGSFRIAYNANKVISVTPFKDGDNLIQALKVESTANREKENLNVQLNVKGAIIG